MKISKIVSLFLLPIACGALHRNVCASVQSAQPQSDKQYLNSIEASATYLASDFAVDGDLSKAAWKKATWVEFDHDPTGKTENPSIKTRVAAVWSDRYIYFAFQRDTNR